MREVKDPCCRHIMISWQVDQGQNPLIAAVKLAMELGEKRDRVRDTLLAGMANEMHRHDWIGTVKARKEGKREAIVTILICAELLHNRKHLIEVTRPLVKEVLHSDEFDVAA